MSAKIALVANTSWFVYNFCSNLIHSLQREGYEVTVLAPSDEYSSRFEELGVKYFAISMNNRGTRPLEDLGLFRRFYGYFKRERPDAVLMYTIKPNIYASVAASVLNIPTINSVTGLGTLFIKNSIVTKVAKQLYKFSMQRSTKVFFLNDEDRALFVKSRMVNQRTAERVPGSGVDTQKFTPATAGPLEDGFTFLLPARLLWDKGVGEFVEAARRLRGQYPDARFVLLGFLGVKNRSAISEAQMDEWEKEGIVSYLGASDNVADEMRRVDCVVLPSYYREGVPRSLLEAASCAKPIITTRAVGCREVVDDGVNGYLCEPRDAGDLADKMARIMDLPQDERLTMGQRGREKMLREFDERIVIERYLAAVHEALSANAKSRGAIRAA